MLRLPRMNSSPSSLPTGNCELPTALPTANCQMSTGFKTTGCFKNTFFHILADHSREKPKKTAKKGGCFFFLFETTPSG
jgi:hypothetical protein